MLNKIIKDYFSFSKKERIGVFFLVFIIILVFILPYLLPEKKASVNKTEWEQFKAQSAQLLKTEKPKTFTDQPGDFPMSPDNSEADRTEITTAFKRHNDFKQELFSFDPNTLAKQGWERLGLRSKTISTIQNYLSKGGRFRRSEDLGKIYGLHKNELEKLMPYVQIIAPAKEIQKKTNNQYLQKNYSYQPPPVKYYPASVTDINTADTTQLIALPGIGSKLALRIVHYREKLGAFYAVDQLSEVYGLPDSTFQELKSRLTVSAQTLRMININTADVNELKQLPYLQWNLANAIIQFRSRHGDFKNLEELLQIDIFTPEMLKKMAPYLTVQ